MGGAIDVVWRKSGRTPFVVTKMRSSVKKYERTHSTTDQVYIYIYIYIYISCVPHGNTIYIYIYVYIYIYIYS